MPFIELLIFFDTTGRGSENRSTDRLGRQSLAAALEGVADRSHQLHRRHDVPQGAEVLPDERQKLLD